MFRNVALVADDGLPGVSGQQTGVAPEEFQATMERFVSFTQALDESGVLCGAEQFQPADTATTVRNRQGEVLLTDGPYAELTESSAASGSWRRPTWTPC